MNPNTQTPDARQITRFTKELEASVSAERLTSYRRVNVVETDLDVAARYLWNIALGAALYLPLNNLEIALRNSLHNAITANIGSDDWFMPRHGILKPREQNVVNTTKANLLQRLQKTPGKQLTSGRLVAELHFGFWAAMLYQYYDQVFWPKLLRPVFPYMLPQGRTRHVLFKRIDEIRAFRNRVFHYEPLWTDPALQGNHNKVVETIGWISPLLQDATRAADQFGVVNAQGPNHYRPMIDSLVVQRYP